MAKVKKLSPAELAANFSFDPPPPGFVIAKPIKPEDYEISVLHGLERAKRLVSTRKRDGYKLYFVRGNDDWKIYTVGLNEVHCLEHVKAELRARKVPKGTFLAGEGILDVDGRDDFDLAAAIFKSNAAKAVETQKKVGMIKAMFFEAVFYAGKCLLWDKPYADRDKVLQALVNNANRRQHLLSVTKLGMPLRDAQEMVTKEGWEGLVLYDKDFRSSFRVDGRDPERPDGCYKWKPIYEDDFIAAKPIYDKSDPDRIRDLALEQIDPKTGARIDCGKFGKFSNQQREWLKTASYPLVIQLKFEQRFPSGKLRHARFMKFRDDKKVSECVAPKSFSA